MRRASGRLRERPEVVVLFALAVAIRLGVAVAYDPSVFHSDSWSYLASADEFTPPRDRPFGYPLLLWPFAMPDHLVLVTTAQHVVGLIAGAVVYWYLDKRGVSRWLAIAATAVVVLDGYALALEQYVMPDAFFAAAALGSLVLLTDGRGTLGLALSGLLVGVAVTLRTAGLFVVACWLLYLLVARRGWRPSAAGIVAAALPIVALGVVNQAEYDRFTLNPSSGWFLYGRIGEIAGCDEIDYRPADRGLCSKPAPGEPQRGAGFYLWSRESPAARRFGSPWDGNLDESNRVLGSFARYVIEQRPGAYAQMVASDFRRYFDPRVPNDGAPTLPTEPRNGPDTPYRRQLVPGYEPEQSFPDDAMRSYVDRIHTWRPLIGLCSLLALIAVAVMFRRGPPRPGLRSEIVVFSGSGLAMLLGSVATSDFSVRYLVPCVPLFVIGGALGLAYLLNPQTRS